MHMASGMNKEHAIPSGPDLLRAEAAVGSHHWRIWLYRGCSRKVVVGSRHLGRKLRRVLGFSTLRSHKIAIVGPSSV